MRVFLLMFVLTVNLAAQLNNGLVGYWSFDEGGGTTATDSSGFGNHGTKFGVTSTQGKVGSAAQFDGVDDYVIISQDSSLDLTSQMSVAMWIKPQAEFRDVLAKTDYDMWRMILNERGTNNVKVVQKVGNADIVVTSGDQVIQEGQWTHIAWWYNGSQIQIFINGLPSGSPKPASGPLLTNRRPLHIGYWAHESDQRYYKGLIDEVRVYSRALSSQEIQSLANQSGGTTTPPPPGPVSSTNQPPTATSINVSAVQNTPVGITLRGADPNGDPLTYRVVVLPQRGALSGTAPNLTYLSTLSGTDSFVFEVNDGKGGTAQGTVNITIQSSTTTTSSGPTGGGTPSGTPISGDYCAQANIRCAHLFPGSDAGQKIQAAINDMVAKSSFGGTVDARGVTNNVLSAVTVKPGIYLVLPAMDFTQTGVLTVNEYATVVGQPNSQGKYSSTRLSPIGVPVSIRVVHSLGADSTRWVHGGMVAYLRVQADSMPSGSSCVEIEQVGENWFMGFVHLAGCKTAGITSGGGAASYPRSWAGAEKLGPLAIMGSGCAVQFRNMAGEIRIDGLSGDNNKSLICLRDSRYNGISLLVENIKTETFQAGLNEPVINIDNAGAVDNITIIGGRHSCLAGGCQDFVRLTNTVAGSGPHLTIMGEYVSGYKNFINDTANGITIPIDETDRLGKINQMIYSGVKGDLSVRSWVARGFLRPMTASTSPSGCSPASEGSLYFNTVDRRLCVCADTGTGHRWYRSDNYTATCR